MQRSCTRHASKLGVATAPKKRKVRQFPSAANDAWLLQRDASTDSWENSKLHCVALIQYADTHSSLWRCRRYQF